MKVLLDMNLSPDWVEVFARSAIETKHWGQVGRFDAPDAEILKWAKDHGFVVFTHDLDFAALLASTNADFPSVVQFRDPDITPSTQGAFMVSFVCQYEEEIKAGCLITIDKQKRRLRLLPLRRT